MISSMYVHVPFCEQICAYCDFFRCRYHSILADRWLNQLKKELDEKTIIPLKTLYIGGGTPSALSMDQMKQLLTILQPYTKELDEYTMEVNADSLHKDKIALLKDFQVNRISMGAQSFQPNLLKKMERVADYSMIQQRIDQLRDAGITNLSLDLIYGLPDQTMEMWMNDLKKAVNLPIEHLSLYALTIEPHSKFGREHITPCDEDLEADFYETAISFLEDHGFEQYEISSFAKNRCYSKHNLAYWHYEDFYGIGCGASGKQQHQRYDNTRDISNYLNKGADPTTIPLDKETEMFEMVMMGLRLKAGVSKQRFQRRFGCACEDVYSDAIYKHKQLHNLIENERCIQATKKGMLILNSVLIDFL